MFYQDYDFLNDGSDNEGDNDFEGNESSDDDDLKRVLRHIGEVQDEMDFEASMEEELATTVKTLEADRERGRDLTLLPSVSRVRQIPSDLPQPSTSSTSTTRQSADGPAPTEPQPTEPQPTDIVPKRPKTVKFEKAPKFYDADYFDSDDDNDDEARKIRKDEKSSKSMKHRVISNDDLFYDPDIDDEDQAWVDEERQHYQPKAKPPTIKKSRKMAKENGLPTSDAVLNCPACMTVLCLDCQRHETYHQQYRAMFVKNCTVDTTQTLRYKDKKHGNKKRRVAASDDAAEMDTEGDAYHPVKCTECGTEVAVYDTDEVYHFFNVLASHA